MKADKRSRACLLFCAVLTILLCWRWQRIFYLMCADYIRSDMPAHVGLALGHNDYSLASVIVRALWAFLGEARGQTALSLVLTCNQVLCVFTLWLLLRQMFPALDKSLALLASLLAHVCGPWILPGQTNHRFKLRQISRVSASVGAQRMIRSACSSSSGRLCHSS